jgi:hypothetical protein
MAKAPLLDLTSEDTERHVLKFDGQTYAFRRGDDLSIQASRDLGRDLTTFHQLGSLLEKKGRLQKNAGVQLETVMRRICAAVLEAPPSVHRKLTSVQRFRIIRVFLMLSLAPALAAKAAAANGPITKTPRRSAGTKSFPSSNGSTAATRSTGGRGIRSV